MQWSPHRETMDPRRENHVHQLPGTPGSFSGSEMFFQGQNNSQDTPEDGQYVSTDILYQQTRRNNIPQLKSLAKELQLWCMERSILLKAQHLAGVLSTTADDKSKVMKIRQTGNCAQKSSSKSIRGWALWRWTCLPAGQPVN